MKSDFGGSWCNKDRPVVTDVKEAGVRESLLMVQDDHTNPEYVHDTFVNI